MPTLLRIAGSDQKPIHVGALTLVSKHCDCIHKYKAMEPGVNQGKTFRTAYND